MHIVVNDFIGGVLYRGMPHYTRNVIDGLKAEGYRVSVVRAPAFFRKLPIDIFYAIAVLFEQTVVPILGLLWRADLTLYPYNSVAIADLFTGRGRIVVHDLEQLNRRISPSKVYYLACYRVLKWLNSPIFTISELSRQRLIQSGLFGHGPITILPNTFYAFERLINAGSAKPDGRKTILLCTGSNANKDFDTVASDYLPKVLADGFRVTVVGLHKPSDALRSAAFTTYLIAGQLRVCGQLSDREVATEYLKHEIVWVHSLREGFGRCVIEGRLAGRRVICTNIPEFVELRDDDVYLYRDAPEFMTTLDRLVHTDVPVVPFSGYPYRALLRKAVHAEIEGLFKSSPSAQLSPPARPSRPDRAHRTPQRSQNP